MRIRDSEGSSDVLSGRRKRRLSFAPSYTGRRSWSDQALYTSGQYRRVSSGARIVSTDTAAVAQSSGFSGMCLANRAAFVPTVLASRSVAFATLKRGSSSGRRA